MIDSQLYISDIKYVSGLNLPWEKLKNSSIMISGASGLIGTFLIDVIMYKNKTKNLNCKIFALGRSSKKAEEKFLEYWGLSEFQFIEQNINESFDIEKMPSAEFVIHLASNTHPVAYATEPINTIITNIIGTKNLLDYVVKKNNKSRFLFASSNEIYGENRGDTELFDEAYCGYINSNTLRAGYPESKRCGEALCQAYIKQENADAVIARLTRSYGPTMLMDDSKALSQFIKKGLAKENIVLKSAGTQYYSYTYAADAVSGLLTVLLKGNSGEAYNIADEKSDVKLKDLAQIIADFSGTEVVFEIPDETEKAGYSTATKARLNGAKIKTLGWSAKYCIKEGIEQTLKIFEQL